ncbi:MAG: MFS transporter [Acidimicrobiales bacterium]
MSSRTSRLPSAYWRQFAASTVSNLGDGANAAAMPLLAARLTDDVRLIASVSFVSMLPWLVLSLPAGVLIDRWRRTSVMIAAEWTRAVMYLSLAALVATDLLRIWTLLVFLLVIGCAEVFYDMTAQAFLPAIVPADRLERANGLLYSAEIVCNGFIGLPLGTWLFVIASAVPFGINGASFALAAVLVAGIARRLPDDRAAHADDGRRRFMTELADGMRWLLAHRNLRTLAILLGVTNAAMMFGESILVKFAFRELGLDERGFGILLALSSAGAIVGGLLGHRIAGRLGITASLVTAYAVFAVADTVRAGWPGIVVFTVMSVAVSLAGTVWNVVTVSYRQRHIPADLFGRVNSAYRFIGTGSVAVGALVGGQVAHSFGLRAPFFLGSAVTVMALVWGLPVLTDGSFSAEPVSSQD